MNTTLKGVKFGDIHTSSFGIYLSKVTVGAPEPKEFSIDIPGADGVLDMSDYFGGVRYKNRKITLVFTFPQRNKSLLKAYSDFLIAVHGRHFDSIMLDDDTDFFYSGRVSVGNLAKNTISKVTVECDCEPYKYSVIKNIVTMDVVSVEFPTQWIYGDVNNDGVIDQNDLELMDSLINKNSYESAEALRADFDFEGVVTQKDKDALDNYLKSGSKKSFKDYVLTGAVPFNFRNRKRQIIDFGEFPVKVTFSVKSIDQSIEGVDIWELRIDNIRAFHFSSRSSYSVSLRGRHEIMISTVNATSRGTFEVSWNSSGIL